MVSDTPKGVPLTSHTFLTLWYPPTFSRKERQPLLGARFDRTSCDSSTMTRRTRVLMLSSKVDV
eukprot:303278-Prymnesium_polylepis.2